MQQKFFQCALRIGEGAYVCTPSLFLYPKEKLHLGSLSIVDVDKHDSQPSRLLAFFLNHINKKADAANKFLFQNEKPFEIDANNIIAWMSHIFASRFLIFLILQRYLCLNYLGIAFTKYCPAKLEKEVALIQYTCIYIWLGVEENVFCF